MIKTAENIFIKHNIFTNANGIATLSLSRK